jgi:hypothetical protein
MHYTTWRSKMVTVRHSKFFKQWIVSNDKGKMISTKTKKRALELKAEMEAEEVLKEI